MTDCRHCHRTIIEDPEDGWIDPEATGDDSVWRETCDANDEDRIAAHEPVEALPLRKWWVTMKHDAGRFTVLTVARNAEEAARNVCAVELAPARSVVSVVLDGDSATAGKDGE